MKAFYPETTNQIIHKGKSGNTYRIDGIEKCHSLYLSLNSNSKFSVQTVDSISTEKVQLATELIHTVHNPIILESYRTGIPEDIATSNGLMWQPKLYDFSLEQALTGKYVVDEANQNGGSIGIVGGGHHVEIDRPLGFGTINTMAIASVYAHSKGLKVAIIDLDTHYSNGCIDILRNREGINVYSIWNKKLDKWKYFESGGNIWHRKIEDVADYFNKLDELVSEVENFKPDLIIYHLGLDVLETDRIGGVAGMTEEKLLERERIIKDLIQSKLKSKFCIFIGGVYMDRTKGEKYANSQRINSTRIQTQILESYCS